MMGDFSNEVPILGSVPMHFDAPPTVSAVRRRLNRFTRAASTEWRDRIRTRQRRGQMPTAEPLVSNAKPAFQLINEPCMRSHPIFKSLSSSELVDFTGPNEQGSARHYRKRFQYPVYETSTIVEEIGPVATFAKGTGAGVDRYGQVPFIREFNRQLQFTESPENLVTVPRGRNPTLESVPGRRTAIRYR